MEAKAFKESIAKKIADSSVVVDTEISQRHMNRTVQLSKQSTYKVDRKSRAYRISQRQDNFLTRELSSTKNGDKRIVFPDTDPTERI